MTTDAAVLAAAKESRLAAFISKFTVLHGAVRELWIIYVTKVLEILAYGMMSSTIVLWLSSDLGYSDSQAGYMIAVWSTIISLFTVLVGSLTDSVGIRKSFLMGFGVCLVSRAFMTFSTSKWIVIPFGLMLLAVGLALMVPVMTAAVKRYTNAAQRSMAFSMYYVLMNVGFAIAGWVFDFVRRSLGETGGYTLPFLFSIPGLVVTYFGLREGVEVSDEGEVTVTPEKKKYEGHSAWAALCLMCKDTLKDTVRIFIAVWKHPSFYRFMIFLTLVVGVRLVFYHMHYTFPKYGIRELGPGAPIGQLFSVLNPVMIVLLVPLVGALTQKISAYRMICVGSVITALSVFFLAVPTPWFAGLADGWLGHLVAHRWLGVEGAVNPMYVSITLMVATLSVGEALWSPRLYEYTAAIAPKGQEASYMALSILPYFGAKFVVGMFSGLLLETYCPAQGARNSEMMWLIIALVTLLSPMGLILFRKYIQVHEAGRAET